MFEQEVGEQVYCGGDGYGLLGIGVDIVFCCIYCVVVVFGYGVIVFVEGIVGFFQQCVDLCMGVIGFVVGEGGVVGEYVVGFGEQFLQFVVVLVLDLFEVVFYCVFVCY